MTRSSIERANVKPFGPSPSPSPRPNEPCFGNVYLARGNCAIHALQNLECLRFSPVTFSSRSGEQVKGKRKDLSLVGQ